MKRFVLLLCAGAGFAAAAELNAVHTVYLLPMSRGMDQYLANRLTNQHVFQVVTDPKLADAVFTDRLGEGFQTQLDNLIPPPPPPAPPATAPPAGAAPDPNAKPPSDNPVGFLATETVNKLDNPGLNSTFGRARGTIFLVDARSRMVVWSTYEPAPSSMGKEMDRTATSIVEGLMKALGMKKK